MYIYVYLHSLMLSVRVYTPLILGLQNDAGVHQRPKSQTLARDRIGAPRTDLILRFMVSIRSE